MLVWKKTLLICTLLLLTGCENAEVKQTLQTGFDKVNPSGKLGICFMVGSINYPYTTKYVAGEENNKYGHTVEFQKNRNDNLNKRLAMFARLGLLSGTPVSDENSKPTGFYQYALTAEGNKYAARWPNGTDTFFCFGRMVVDSVGDMDWGGDVEKRWGSQEFIFHVEGDIPEWATSPELNMIRKLSEKNEPVSWNDVDASWPYKRTSEGLKPMVPPSTYIIGT